ncbi:MAG: hypothetical protein IJE59_02945 [Clostridia bacterium]|nr:hypothetical protein [Clostridia bacterium]
MKGKILTFIIGLLVGAIIATAGFLIYSKTVANNSNQPGMIEMNGNGQMGGQQPGNMGEPPEKPSGDNGEQPPTKPEEANNNTSN